MFKKLTIVVLVFSSLALTTAPASACSGLLCWLGVTDNTEIRNQRMIETERIRAERDADVAQIEAQAQERVRQAEAEVERVRQLQYESEAQRDVAIAQAQAKAEEYKAMIAGLTDEKVTAIMAESDQQLAALQHQSEIAIAGITETGSTERWRIAGGWIAFVAVALIIGAIVLVWLHTRATASQSPTFILLDDSAAFGVRRALQQRKGLTNGEYRGNEIVHIENEY